MKAPAARSSTPGACRQTRRNTPRFFPTPACWPDRWISRPGIFNLTFQGPGSSQRVQTTLAKQLALYVTIYSPIQMAADLPENYEARPDVFQFIVDVPTDWEESHCDSRRSR